jgi:hypothetical protein
VNNTAGIGSAISQPALWNSIAYSNGGAAVPALSDLNGFSFPPFATGGLVNNSDFCGAPWTPALGLCQTPGALMAGCINTNPMFLAPGFPTFNFGLTCGAGGCVTCASGCVDAGIAIAPFLPPTDAVGALRNFNLTGVVPPLGPDMGALEKQGCTP